MGFDSERGKQAETLALLSPWDSELLLERDGLLLKEPEDALVVKHEAL